MDIDIDGVLSDLAKPSVQEVLVIAAIVAAAAGAALGLVVAWRQQRITNKELLASITGRPCPACPPLATDHPARLYDLVRFDPADAPPFDPAGTYVVKKHNPRKYYHVCSLDFVRRLGLGTAVAPENARRRVAEFPGGFGGSTCDGAGFAHVE